VVREYYGELKRSFKTKELFPNRLHLDDDAKLIGTNEFFDGKEAIVKTLENFIHLIKDCDIQHQYFDHESCCSILNMVTIIPEIEMKSTERIVVAGGKIIEIYVYYDTRAWQNLMQRMQTLNSSVAFFQK
jgi:ketosteroid isomerase-like protein